MKRYIYITLFVFASLFSQAFGAQYESPTFYGTICAEPDARNLQMSDLKTLISIFLYDREDSIWLEYGNTVKVELGDITGHVIENDTSLFDTLSGEKINATKTIQLDVEYTRKLVFSKIPSTENEAQKTSATLALWHIFGKLLSETDTERVTKISDEASITTLHKATFVYRFELAFPENEFKIQGDSCLVDNQIVLSVDSAYLPYTLKWQAEGMDPVEASGSSVKFESKSDDNYLYSVSCTATACKGETRSATFVIGKPTPKPTMEDVNCIASSETSFVAKVKGADSRFSYHWIFEEADGNRATQFKQGDLVEFKISLSRSGVLQLYSTGGCRISDTDTQVLHRSIGTGNIQLQGDTNCIFIGDTLRLSLSETSEDTLVWQIAGNTTMLPPHNTYNYPAVQDKDNVVVSVYAQACPNNIITDTFNIREDFSVSLGTSPMCISANEYQVIKLTSNGVNPEVHWYGNGVEIDSSTYKKEDSIRLKLTNSGDQNLYVKVTAKECGRERDTLLVLHPKPETPSLDPLLGMLTPCIPLGMVDTIELRVQPQDGVKFKWEFSDNEKFRRIAESDSHSISVATNFGLLDSEEDKTIKVNISAYTEGCPDTLEKQESVYANGAGLGSEWKIGSKHKPVLGQDFLTVGFYQKDVTEISTYRVELAPFAFSWKCSIDYKQDEAENQALTFKNNTIYPFDVNCLLMNEDSSCYSYYSATIEENATTSQSVVSSPKNSVGFEGTDGAFDVAYTNVVRTEDNPIDGIGVVLAPNPTQGNTLLYLENTNIEKQIVIEIFTEQGVCLYRKTASANVEELPTARFQSGLYFVRVRIGEEDPLVKKIIVK